MIDHPSCLHEALADIDSVALHHVHPRDRFSGSFTITTRDGRSCQGRFGPAFVEINGHGMPERLARVRCSPQGAWRSTTEFADMLRAEIDGLLRDLTAHDAWCSGGPDLAIVTGGFTVVAGDEGDVQAELVVSDPLTPSADIVVTGRGSTTGLVRFSMRVISPGQAVPAEISEFVDIAVPLVLQRRTGLTSRQLFDAIDAAAVKSLRQPAYTGDWALTAGTNGPGRS